ncbi:Acetamidase/Formamidase [Atractiella rhizophila]|nr:Acetamidase/Formamidase [Atractiella rhizophila]
MPGTVSIHSHQNHLKWDNSLPPIARVSSGDTVSFSCLDASNGQITASSTTSSLQALDFSRLDQVNGPIYVESAKPGDVLEVEFLSVKHATWGWTAVIKDFGLLANEYEESLKIWKLDEEEGYAWFNKQIRVPLDPFMGEIGGARGEPGAWSTIPPYKTGGNIDTKYVTEGSRLFLPIECEGALFSIGDGHACQGDGEVCGTAIETPMEVVVRLTLVKTPHILSLPQNNKSKGFYATTGVGDSLLEASKEAIRAMIAWLSAEKGLEGKDAYMLCSVVVDLRITEIVDMPNFVVGAFCPLSIFVDRGI